MKALKTPFKNPHPYIFIFINIFCIIRICLGEKIERFFFLVRLVIHRVPYYTASYRVNLQYSVNCTLYSVPVHQLAVPIYPINYIISIPYTLQHISGRTLMVGRLYLCAVYVA